jgi:hypothetical protein
MRRFLLACATLAWVALAAPVQAEESSSPPLRPTSDGSCSKKRTDACGCHHHFGLRHCHPKRKTPRCEAPVRADVAAREQREHVSL